MWRYNESVAIPFVFVYFCPGYRWWSSIDWWPSYSFVIWYRTIPSWVGIVFDPRRLVHFGSYWFDTVPMVVHGPVPDKHDVTCVWTIPIDERRYHNWSQSIILLYSYPTGQQFWYVRVVVWFDCKFLRNGSVTWPLVVDMDRCPWPILPPFYVPTTLVPFW